jgi:predicted nucleic acid-binding protein
VSLTAISTRPSPRRAETATLPPGDRLLLDAATLVAYLDGGEVVSPVAACVVDEFVRDGRNEGIVSMVTVMELLVRPLRHGPAGYRHALDFLTNFPNLRAAVIDLPVAQEVASLRASHNFRPPDALTIASGLVYQVGHLVTNDAGWKTRLAPVRRRVAVCYLADHLPFR